MTGVELQVAELRNDTAAFCAALTVAIVEQDEEGAQQIAGTVALSRSDRKRLDLSWWGSWAVVGLVLVLLIAPQFYNSFRFWR